MIATIILGVLAVLFAYLTKYKHGQWGLKVSFTLIFFFLALRYKFGNDYKTYLDGFIGINQSNDIYLLYWIQHFEPGWIFLNKLFGPIGFFNMIAVLAFLNCIVYYRFIEKYIPVQYYWLAVFIYIFNPVFLLVSASAMRQSIAIMLFVFSLDYLYRKDAIRYFLCVGLASFFHFSALILIPVYLVGKFNWRINKATGVLIFLIFVSLYFFGTSIATYFRQFIAFLFDRYVNYEDTGELGSGLGAIYFSGLLIITLYFERLQNREIALIFKLAVLSLLMMPLNLIFDLSYRLMMFFSIGLIIVYPAIFMKLKRAPIKMAYLTIIIIFTLSQFAQFFFSEVQKEDYGVYQTVFSAPQWY